MNKVERTEKKLRALIDQLEDRLTKTDKGSKEALKIRRELNKLSKKDTLHN